MRVWDYISLKRSATTAVSPASVSLWMMILHQHHSQAPLTQSVANQQSQTTRLDGKLLSIPLSLSFYLSQPSRTLPDLATFSSNFSLSVNHMLPIVDGCGNNLSCNIPIMPLDLHLSSSPIYLSLRRAGHHVRLALPPSITVGRALVR